MTRSRRLERLMVVLVLAAVYFVLGKLGLKLAFVHASATAVWPPTGLSLAAFLLWGYGVWPGILIGAFFVNLTTEGTIATSIGIGVGNTLEGLVGAYLVNRFANGCNAFDRAQDVFKFAGLSAGLSTTVSATIGVTSLAVGGFAEWAKVGPIWLTWWLGDAAGALVVAPLVILWSASPPPRWTWIRWFEIGLLLLCLILVGQIVFGPLSSWEMKNYPLEFLCIPFLIWAAFRLGQREGTLAMALLSGIAIWGTLRGFGPFVRHTYNESLLLLQAFMGVCSVMTLSLASVVSERRRAEEQLRQLAVTDPVTGLANYRYLMQVLEQEIQRSERTLRPFVLLMLDLDGLKKINDAYGHLVGTRALWRLAGVLSRNCRAIDTAARYGGDEFAVILVETGIEEAGQIVRRIVEELKQESEQPRLFVSVGVAVYPQNGVTREALMAAADRSLYEDKSANRKGRLTPPRSLFPSLR